MSVRDRCAQDAFSFWADMQVLIYLVEITGMKRNRVKVRAGRRSVHRPPCTL